MIKNVRYNSDVRNTKNRVTLLHTKKNNVSMSFLTRFEGACPQNVKCYIVTF